MRIAFVEELEQHWRAKYGNTSEFAPYSKSQEFGPDIQLLFNTYNSERAQKIGQIRANIAKAQEETTKNLTLALERGEQLEIMSQKADTIKESAQAFHREANNVKSAMCWQKWRFRILIIVILLALIGVIVAVIFILKK